MKPGDDFYSYASGTWQKTTQIPADRSSYGMFHKLQDLSLERTRTILEKASQDPSSKIGLFYASFMDEKAVDAKGVAPIKPWLAEPDRNASRARNPLGFTTAPSTTRRSAIAIAAPIAASLTIARRVFSSRRSQSPIASGKVSTKTA